MIVDEHRLISSLLFSMSVQRITRQGCEFAPNPAPGTAIERPHPTDESVPPAFDHFLKYRGRQRHPIRHHCSAAVTNGVVSKPSEEQKQTPFPQFTNQKYQIHGRLRSSTLHWQRFLNRPKNLAPGGILNREPQDCEADTLTAEPSLCLLDHNQL